MNGEGEGGEVGDNYILALGLKVHLKGEGEDEGEENGDEPVGDGAGDSGNIRVLAQQA